MKSMICIIKTVCAMVWPIFFYMLVGDGVTVLILSWMSPEELDFPLLVTLISGVVATGVLLPVFCKKERILKIDGWYGNSLRGQRFLKLVIAAGATSITVNHFLALSGLMQTYQGYEKVSIAIEQSSLPLQLLTVGIAAPWAEELVFRGFFFHRLRCHVPFLIAAIGSSLAFGLFHGNIVQGLYGFLMGMMLAAVYEVHETFLAPVFFHMSANLTSTLLNLAGLSKLGEKGILLILALIYGSIMITISYIPYLYRLKREEISIHEITDHSNTML